MGSFKNAFTLPSPFPTSHAGMEKTRGRTGVIWKNKVIQGRVKLSEGEFYSTPI